MLKTKEYLNRKREQVEAALERYMLSSTGDFAGHIEAMRYSLFVGGKRIRPILCIAAAETITDRPDLLEDILPIACAIECIHTYSLIHDDLPAMDNDDLRRGKPTNHKLFGEAAAILAGDGLLTFAFELLSRPSATLPPERLLRICNLVARGAGPEGMVGGQSLDIANENSEYPFELLQTIHKSKTGALIRCSVQAGAVATGASEEQQQKLAGYGTDIGLAFQIVDDLLDVTSTTEQLGKTAGSDQQNGKATYPAYFGIAETRKKALAAVESAKDNLSGFDHKADPLRNLADYIYARTN